MDIVTGKTRPDSGRVIRGEKSVSLLKLSKAQIARAGVGHKFQRPTVFEDQSVQANLLMVLKKPRAPLAVLLFRPARVDLVKVAALAAQVGLTDHLPRKAGELNHGQKQWLEIGMLLAREPRLLLVDEPAAGMTPQEREKGDGDPRRGRENPRRGRGGTRYGGSAATELQSDRAARRRGAGRRIVGPYHQKSGRH